MEQAIAQHSGQYGQRWKSVVERAQEAWHKWIPGWLPLLVALLWIGMQYQRQNDRLDSLEKQMQAVQEYMRTQHAEKSGYQGSNRRYDDSEPKTSDGYPVYQPNGRP